ncbi:MAG: 50S ribosomal protein L1, partial [Candidatus Micrarchaeia archaeon]
IKEAVEEMLKEKGKRKFKQSVELIINFKGIDFTKAENRLNLDIIMPKGMGGKENKVVVIGEETTTHNAKKLGADVVVKVNEIESFGKDVKNLKKMAKDHVFIAEPKAMGIVAKNLAKVLGPRGKIPSPLVGDLKQAIERARKTVKVQTKGKYLPTVQCFVGTEEMGAEELKENVMEVFERVKTKVPTGNIKSAFVKLTMGKPVKIAG